MMAGDDGLVRLSCLLRLLKNSGVWRTDPRLAVLLRQINKYIDVQTAEFDAHRDVLLTREMFHQCIHDNTVLIRRAFGGDFVIPVFSTFCAVIDDIYWACRTHSEGKVCRIHEISHKLQSVVFTASCNAACCISCSISVHLSVHPSHAGIVSKWMDIAHWIEFQMI